MNVFTCSVVSNLANGSSYDFGGGLYDLGTGTSILNSTVTGNQAAFGGGLYLGGTAPTVGNTILADNTTTGGPGAGPEASGTFTSTDYNLIRNTNGCTLMGTITHCLFNQAPLLGPLRDNGGPTFTLALLAGSPAIDKGYSFGFTTDQRGRVRPYDFPASPNAGVGAGSDIGAFELSPPLLSITQAGGNKALVSWPATNGGYTLESNTNVNLSASWTVVPGVPAVVSGRYTVTNAAVGVLKSYRLRGP